MKKALILLTYFVFVLCVCVSAQEVKEDNLASILKSMSESESKAQSLEVDYKEEILYTAASQKQQIIGNLKFIKPKSFFIVQKTPQEQRIYISNNKVIVWTPSNSQAIINSWKAVINTEWTPITMIDFASNWQTMQKSNSLRYISENADNYILELIPISEEWIMTIHISKDTLRPSKTLLKGEGYNINIDFSNYKINQISNRSIFNFKPPSGVEIINLD
jgi:outer membrane lipoprotein-sorting protein